MKEELYIDNNPVDIDDNTGITLNYNSNLFKDVSKIVSNNTYSIKLPLTVRNSRVIDHAHLPSYTTRFPRINHKGRYIRNGVEIVPDANVTLMEVSDTIDVAMAWGNISNFANIVNAGTLQELPYAMVENEDYIVWSKSLTNSARLPWLDYGYKDGEPDAWFHPAVTAKWVLDKISASSGVSFNIPEDKLKFINNLVIPLLTRKGSDKQAEECTINLDLSKLASWSAGVRGYKGYRILFAQTVLSNEMLKTYTITSGSSEEKFSGLIGNYDNIILGIKGSIVLNIPESSYTSDIRLEIYTGFQGGNLILTVYPSEYVKNGNNYEVTFAVDESTTELGYSGSVNGDIVFSVQGLNESGSSISGNISVRPLIESVALKSDGKYAKFFFVLNLPDIKQIDFIKAIASICGLFAMPDKGRNTVKFVTMDDIIANKPKALDWTKRVVASYPQNRPKTLSFGLDGFAQRNLYKWKDDDEGVYDGTIYVDDKTLEEEAEAVTLPFAWSEVRSSRTGPYTRIPLYSYNENGELEYDDTLEPRLLLLKNETVGTFEGLAWPDLLVLNYQSYQDAVREPKVITENIEIREYELKNLDMSVPVYLGQYGKFYAIISIKAEKTGICECKLYQL